MSNNSRSSAIVGQLQTATLSTLTAASGQQSVSSTVTTETPNDMPPDNPSTASLLLCQSCAAPVNKLSKLHLSHHNINAPMYRCSCGHENPRKDNYLRHVDRKKPHDSGTFKCKCKKLDTDVAKHVLHVKECGVRQRGRPARRPKTEV